MNQHDHEPDDFTSWPPSPSEKWFIPDAQYADDNIHELLKSVTSERADAIAELRTAAPLTLEQAPKTAHELFELLVPHIKRYADRVICAAASAAQEISAPVDMSHFDDRVDVVLDDTCEGMFSQFPATLGHLLGRRRDDGGMTTAAVSRLWLAWNPLGGSNDDFPHQLRSNLKLHLCNITRQGWRATAEQTHCDDAPLPVPKAHSRQTTKQSTVNRTTFLNNILRTKAQRGGRPWTRATLADRGGIAKSTISNWERKGTTLERATAQAIAEALDVPLNTVTNL